MIDDKVLMVCFKTKINAENVNDQKQLFCVEYLKLKNLKKSKNVFKMFFLVQETNPQQIICTSVSDVVFRKTDLPSEQH